MSRVSGVCNDFRHARNGGVVTQLLLTPNLLNGSTRSVARMIAGSRLRTALEQGARLERCLTGTDAAAGAAADEAERVEAVHEFRVALRRLRSWLRAYRPFLGDDLAARRTVRQLRRVSRRAGQVRDLHVQMATLRARGARVTAPGAEAARWLAGRLAAGIPRAERRLLAALVDELPQAAARLSRQIAQLAVGGRAPPCRDEGMAAVTARLIGGDAKALKRKVRRWRRHPDNMPDAHATRIAAKRLRYLLEAFGTASRPASAAVRQLRQMQGALGSAHDADVLLETVLGIVIPEGTTLPPRAVKALQRSLAHDARARLKAALRLLGSGGLDDALAAADRLRWRLRRSPQPPHDGVILTLSTHGMGA